MQFFTILYEKLIKMRLFWFWILAGGQARGVWGGGAPPAWSGGVRGGAREPPRGGGGVYRWCPYHRLQNRAIVLKCKCLIRAGDPHGLYKSLGAMVVQDQVITKHIVSVVVARLGADVSKVFVDTVGITGEQMDGWMVMETEWGNLADKNKFGLLRNRNKVLGHFWGLFSRIKHDGCGYAWGVCFRMIVVWIEINLYLLKTHTAGLQGNSWHPPLSQTRSTNKFGIRGLIVLGCAKFETFPVQFIALCWTFS